MVILASLNPLRRHYSRSSQPEVDFSTSFRAFYPRFLVSPGTVTNQIVSLRLCLLLVGLAVFTEFSLPQDLYFVYLGRYASTPKCSPA